MADIDATADATRSDFDKRVELAARALCAAIAVDPNQLAFGGVPVTYLGRSFVMANGWQREPLPMWRWFINEATLIVNALSG